MARRTCSALLAIALMAALAGPGLARPVADDDMHTIRQESYDVEMAFTGTNAYSVQFVSADEERRILQQIDIAPPCPPDQMPPSIDTILNPQPTDFPPPPAVSPPPPVSSPPPPGMPPAVPPQSPPPVSPPPSSPPPTPDMTPPPSPSGVVQPDGTGTGTIGLPADSPTPTPTPVPQVVAQSSSANVSSVSKALLAAVAMVVATVMMM